MKIKTIYSRVSPVCFALCTGLIGLFYLLADFGKALPKLCGLIQLVGAVILCIAIFAKSGRMSKLYGGIVLAITLGQAVALFNWVVWNSVRPWLFGHALNLGWFGFFVHAVFAVWGSILAVKTLSKGYITAA